MDGNPTVTQKSTIPQENPQSTHEKAPPTVTETVTAVTTPVTETTEKYDAAIARLGKAAIAYGRAQKRAKTLKKQVDFMLESLLEMVDGNAEDSDCIDDEIDQIPEGNAPMEEDAPETYSDNWPTMPIQVLNLSKSVTDKLLEMGLDNLGKLEAKRAEIYDGRDKWPKGIGPAKITEIENSILGILAKIKVEPSANDSDVIDPSFQVVETSTANPDVQSEKEILAETHEFKKIWDEGYNARILGKAPEDCPYVTKKGLEIWVEGWYARNETEIQPADNLDDIDDDDEIGEPQPIGVSEVEINVDDL